jgi:dienelactone hydrolase
MNRARVFVMFAVLLLLSVALFVALSVSDAAAQRRPDLREERCVLTLPKMDQVKLREGIVYKQEDGAELRFDLYLPEGVADLSRSPGLAARSGPPPVVVFVNGVGGSRAADGAIPMREWGIYRSWARLCAVSGMAAVVHDVRAEHASADAADLVAYVHAHAAELGVSGDDVCLWSCSANVRVGFPLAYDPKNDFVKATVLFYGNPDTSVARPDLPVLLGRAGLDSPNLNAAMDRFAQRALAANAPITILNVHNGHHAFDLVDDDDQSRAAVQATLDWMAAQLSPGVATARALRGVELEARRAVAAGNWVSADRAFRQWLAAEPENAHAIYAHAGVLYQMQRFDEAAAAYEKTASLRMMVPFAYYNGSCSYARAGKTEKAYELLEKAVETGAFTDRGAIRDDPDFAGIAGEKRFQEIVAKSD